jgi:hypothetical protein
VGAHSRGENLELTVERFLSVARRFEKWAARGTDQGLDAAQNGLRLIAQLYAAGLELPGFPEEVDPNFEEVLVSEAERRQVFRHSARLPFQYYSEIFDPLPVPPTEEPVTGDIADDIADIFRDVVEGIRLFDRGQEKEALWSWVFGIRYHWGEHATSAMRALFWYLSHSDE